MKKISFKKLCDLVANIDYVFADSFPINFSVINGKEENRFESGIGETDDEVIMNDYEFSCCANTFQYVVDCDTNMIIDIQDPDIMEYDEICDMLKKKCGITKNSVIMLDSDISFDGEILNITDELILPELKVKWVDDEDECID